MNCNTITAAVSIFQVSRSLICVLTLTGSQLNTFCFGHINLSSSSPSFMVYPMCYFSLSHQKRDQ